MTEYVYEKLAKHLNTFPTSFPRKEEGTEITLLKKFFTEEKAEIAAKLHLMFGGQAKNTQAVANEIYKEKAMKVFTEAEDAGLVHFSSNVQGLLGICSCCGCCCIFFRGMTKLKNPRVFAKFDFEVALDSDRCIACGECVDRCWQEALSV